MRNILEEEISNLGINKAINSKLRENGIFNVYQLCECTKINLIDLGCNNSQVKELAIKLQLVGLDLKRNHAKRNTLVDTLK